MFKGFQDTSRDPMFRGFPSLNFQQNNSAYGFSGVTFWLDAAYGLNTQTNLGAVSRWQARVGSSVYVQQSAANQPTLLLSAANFNGMPCVQAINNSRFMDSGIGYGMSYSPLNNTIAFVAKVDTSNFCNGVIGYTLSTSFSGLHLGGTDSNLTGAGIVNNNSQTYQGISENSSTRIVVITGTNIIVNGVVERTGTNLSLLFNYHLLFRAGTGFSNLVGQIAEIIKYDFSMSQDNAIMLSANINLKYQTY